VVFVLIPIALQLDLEARKRFIAAVFPHIFRLASVLAAITLSAGAALNYGMTGWRNLDVYLGTRWEIAIFSGGLLGLLLAGFHFFVEARIEGRVAALAEGSDQETEALARLLRIIPRLGLGVIVVIFVLMMIGARGI
jgi:hypothetical protein